MSASTERKRRSEGGRGDVPRCALEQAQSGDEVTQEITYWRTDERASCSIDKVGRWRRQESVVLAERRGWRRETDGWMGCGWAAWRGRFCTRTRTSLCLMMLPQWAATVECLLMGSREGEGRVLWTGLLKLRSGACVCWQTDKRASPGRNPSQPLSHRPIARS